MEITVYVLYSRRQDMGEHDDNYDSACDMINFSNHFTASLKHEKSIVTATTLTQWKIKTSWTDRARRGDKDCQKKGLILC